MIIWFLEKRKCGNVETSHFQRNKEAIEYVTACNRIVICFSLCVTRLYFIFPDTPVFAILIYDNYGEYPRSSIAQLVRAHGC